MCVDEKIIVPPSVCFYAHLAIYKNHDQYASMQIFLKICNSWTKNSTVVYYAESPDNHVLHPCSQF